MLRLVKLTHQIPTVSCQPPYNNAGMAPGGGGNQSGTTSGSPDSHTHTIRRGTTLATTATRCHTCVIVWRQTGDNRNFSHFNHQEQFALAVGKLPESSQQPHPHHPTWYHSGHHRHQVPYLRYFLEADRRKFWAVLNNYSI